MAIVHFVKHKRAQTVGGLNAVINYCCKDAKVDYQGRPLISGINCVPQCALQEFMNTKRQYGSTDGRMYYHMVQSFRPDDPVTPEMAHEIALKLAEHIPGYEIIVATHTDREHLHSHFVINSVSYETGLKYHSNEESLMALRKASDELCMQYGLSVVKPKKKQKKERTMSDREYRAYAKGDSWKMNLEINIDECMTLARDRGHFIRLMEYSGYEVRWEDTRKNITYTTPDGYKCCDDKMNGLKYLKEMMEYEFSMGYNAIAYALNDMHIPARKGEWSQTSIVNILTNEVYLGKIRWRREPVKKVVKDGFLTKTRILNDDYELYDGMHEPIITEEQWELVKAAQKKRNHTSVNTDRQLQNPFAGILVCGKCGAIMKRTVPDKRRNPTPWFRCTTRGCDCKIIKCEVVENSIRDAMQEWLDEYTIQIEADQQPKVDPTVAALEAIRGQLAQLQLQQENICEYLEKGVYTIDMFTKRNASLAKEINQLQSAEADLLRQQSEGSQKKQATVQIIPTTQHILENYPILTVAEKNRLWKLVMTKATVYRSPDSELTVNIYPNLPK